MRTRLLAPVVLLITALGPVTASAVAASPTTWFERGTSMQPRLQWNANFGYCGETSFISAGMRYGQYTSQWTARARASPGVPQTRASSQLLLGANDLDAARRMRLDAAAFATGGGDSPQSFLGWVKKRFLRGEVVIIGVNNNVRTLNEPLPGEIGSYDHIVPVFGIGSQQRLSRDSHAYSASDSITISDNGLHNVGPNLPFLYSYRFDGFPLTRRAANQPGGPIYSLSLGHAHYGTAIRGVLDPEGVTVPLRLTSDSASEGAQNQSRLDAPPPATRIRLTAHVSIPDPTRSYTVYMYDDFRKVPIRDFHTRADQAVATWTIPPHSGRHWSTTISALSSDTRVFRVVPAMGH